MVRAALFAVALVVGSQSALSDQLETGPDGSMLCPDPSNIMEAYYALGDPAWFAETGCFIAPAATPLVRIGEISSASTVWRVRYMPQTGPHRTLYGHYYTFNIVGKGTPKPWRRLLEKATPPASR